MSWIEVGWSQRLLSTQLLSLQTLPFNCFKTDEFWGDWLDAVHCSGLLTMSLVPLQRSGRVAHTQTRIKCCNALKSAIKKNWASLTEEYTYLWTLSVHTGDGVGGWGLGGRGVAANATTIASICIALIWWQWEGAGGFKLLPTWPGCAQSV